MADMPGFAAALGRFGATVKTTHAAKVKAVATAVHRAVVEATPIDTSRAMTNWVPSLNAPAPGETAFAEGSAGSTRDIAAQIADQNLDQTLAGYRFGDAVHLTNNTPYILDLHEGSSPQAAPGVMVEMALQAGEAEARRSVR